MRKAAAVVIGVDKTGGFDALKSAATGAKEVADWLRLEEGFDVECLTDVNKTPVTSRQVEDAINKFVTDPPTYDFLLVYFSGHGQYHTRADHWLLSGAPTSTSEAINLEGAIATAKLCGIPNVVFISDACRTLPDTQARSHVNGIDGFPNYAIESDSKVDYFKATSQARPAYETAINGREQSVLTCAILSAFDDPVSESVKVINSDGQTISVVPNRKLEEVLKMRVLGLLDGVRGNPIQKLDINVPSADDVYIGKVRAKQGGLPPGKTPPGPGPRPPDRSTPGRRPPPDRSRLINFSNFETEREFKSRIATDILGGKIVAAREDNIGRILASEFLPTETNDHFETQTGFVVAGARVAAAATIPNEGSAIEALNFSNDSRGDAVKVFPGPTSSSVAILLKDGRCVVLPALTGYLGHAKFDDSGLATVSYVPSSNNGRYGDYLNRKIEIDRLRALVTLSFENNMFHVRSDSDARELAENIRMEKAYDPTLGLYACYAFAQAGMQAKVRDILRYMNSDLGRANLFDVLMLSGRGNELRPGEVRVPICPMLTQGWNLLRAYRTGISPTLCRVSNSLANSLWTTFTGEGAQAVFNAVKNGKLE